jgi:hypothetical protein
MAPDASAGTGWILRWAEYIVSSPTGAEPAGWGLSRA